MQPMAHTAFISGSFGDTAKKNHGGLDDPGTLIEQGDLPVNAEDLKASDVSDLEYREMLAMDDDYDSTSVATVNSGSDIEEGVSMARSMYNHEHIRKTSDY